MNNNYKTKFSSLFKARITFLFSFIFIFLTSCDSTETLRYSFSKNFLEESPEKPKEEKFEESQTTKVFTQVRDVVKKLQSVVKLPHVRIAFQGLYEYLMIEIERVYGEFDDIAYGVNQGKLEKKSEEQRAIENIEKVTKGLTKLVILLEELGEKDSLEELEELNLWVLKKLEETRNKRDEKENKDQNQKESTDLYGILKKEVKKQLDKKLYSIIVKFSRDKEKYIFDMRYNILKILRRVLIAFD